MPAPLPGPAADPALVEVARDALLAPSLENSQPWRWRVGSAAMELYADRSRQVTALDPTGRALVVSCGAALHHALVSLRARSLTPRVDVFPDGEDSDLLARVDVGSGRGWEEPRGADEVADLLALRARRTDRRRFTAWPLPRPVMTRLTERARGEGAEVVEVTDAVGRSTVTTLAGEARRRRASASATGERAGGSVEHRDPPDPPIAVATADAVVVIGGAVDTPRAWLTTGRGLSALWLRAHREELAVVPMSEVVEVEATRVALRDGVLAGRLEPHVVVRVGWRPLGRTPGDRPPRRPLASAVEVLGPATR